ncbi:Putative mycofactocin biosynthesis glycosyltransferase MftF [Microbacterium oleivorans]|uniref:glycosyltransferase family 2 protein n=1 Tax=Microbacterium oleivorans TaxID=273677 RepID=UPI0009763DE2|nr:glycosyltransferase [Microbacterium oleivorans]AZS42679.1 Putative mycofactocin biosynthesis glycosyltransferase MftF [Microbacterium oleivorans]
MIGPDTSILIAVPSYRRPDRLARLLTALAEQRHDIPAQVDVVVIDNDPAGTAADAAAAARAHYRLEPRPGLAAVRNSALDEAITRGADALVFIDDDEVPAPGWLQALVSPWSAGTADLVSGRVESEFDVPPAEWIVAGGFFRRVRFADGERMPAAPTNNLLIDVPILRSTGIRFDEEFGRTGGEDIHFTSALTRRGARIVAAPRAVVTDHVPADRATPSWVLRRAFRVGTTTARSDIRLADGAVRTLRRRLRWLAVGLARALAGVGRWAIGAVTRSTVHRARGARLAARGIGMAAGGTGFRYLEYRPRTPQ